MAWTETRMDHPQDDRARRSEYNNWKATRMSTEELQRQLDLAVQAVEEMCRIVESMEKLLHMAIEERDAAIAYIQASDLIGRAKL